MEDRKEEIRKKKKDGWIETVFSIEAVAIDEEVLKSSLEKHANEMSAVSGVFVYDTHFSETIKVKNPTKGVEEAHSRIVSMKFLAKDLMTLVSLAISFGPSSIEILGPSKKEVNMSEMQNMLNLISGVIHQFAAAGAGGIIISPKKK